MALTHQTVVGFADSAERGIRPNSQDSARILIPLLFRADMVGADAGIVVCVEAEMPSDFAQIGILGRANAAVRQSDMKEPAEQILEHRPIVREQTAYLPSIALKPSRALPGEIEDQPHVIFLARRDLKDLTKGSDLVAGNRAVGPRHLGAERDHGNREGDAAARVVISAFAAAMCMPSRNVMCHTVQQGTERPAKRQVAGTGNDAADKA